MCLILRKKISEISQGIVSAENKAEELYNKLLKRMLIALVDELILYCKKYEVGIQYSGVVDIINKTKNLGELREIVPGIVLQLDSFIENAVTEDVEQDFLIIRGKMENLIEELQNSAGSP